MTRVTEGLRPEDSCAVGEEIPWIHAFFVSFRKHSKDIDFINDCGLLTSQNPPQTGCPYGYVMFDDATQFSSTATYWCPVPSG